jgi:hypothetical protein
MRADQGLVEVTHRDVTAVATGQFGPGKEVELPKVRSLVSTELGFLVGKSWRALGAAFSIDRTAAAKPRKATPTD